MINVKFSYNAQIGIATYTIFKDDVVYDDEYVIELAIPFDVAFSLSKFMDEIIFLSAESGYEGLLNKLDSFVSSHFGRTDQFYPKKN